MNVKLVWAVANVVVGYGIAVGLCFTVVSLVRSYLLRRLFNLIQIRSGS